MGWEKSTNIAEPLNDTDALRRIDMDNYYLYQDKMIAIATTAEATAGTNDTNAMTPLQTLAAMNNRFLSWITSLFSHVLTVRSEDASYTTTVEPSKTTITNGTNSSTVQLDSIIVTN